MKKNSKIFSTEEPHDNASPSPAVALDGSAKQQSLYLIFKQDILETHSFC